MNNAKYCRKKMSIATSQSVEIAFERQDYLSKYIFMNTIIFNKLLILNRISCQFKSKYFKIVKKQIISQTKKINRICKIKTQSRDIKQQIFKQANKQIKYGIYTTHFLKQNSIQIYHLRYQIAIILTNKLQIILERKKEQQQNKQLNK
ncbi:hypothetical protein ABPG74_020144 [Tetrahymena malaccensis]